MKKVYLDYAATTPVDKKVFEKMKSYFCKNFGNASSLHSFGRVAREAIEEAREKIAKCMKVNPNEIIFTSSGTESNNLALKGICEAYREKGKHIIVSAIEHDCILNTAKYLKTKGFDVDFAPVDEYGIVKLDALEKMLRKDTILVSVMTANNEIGTMEPIEEIAEICKEKNVLFHTDACQAFAKIPINMENIDLLTASSHKIYGPKGAALLFKKEGIKLTPLLHGGGHEFGSRSSTENVPAIVGFGYATEEYFKNRHNIAKKEIKIRDYLIKKVLEIPDSRLNGHPVKRLPNNAHFSFKYIEGESLIFELDEAEFAVSTGSACSSKSLEPSHVLLAIGLKREEAHGSLRVTIGKDTKFEDIKRFCEILPEKVDKLRKISPFKKGWKI
ncbi:MAG: cysteine desulfurase family protein [archaeon]